MLKCHPVGYLNDVVYTDDGRCIGFDDADWFIEHHGEHSCTVIATNMRLEYQSPKYGHSVCTLSETATSDVVGIAIAKEKVWARLCILRSAYPSKLHIV